MPPTEVHTQLSSFDLIPPTVYKKFVIYLPLAYDATPELVFKNLQTALGHTFEQLPFLNGRVFLRPPRSLGWRPGQIGLGHTEPWHADEGSEIPRQLTFKDLSAQLDNEELRDRGFPISAFEDDLVVSAPFIRTWQKELTHSLRRPTSSKADAYWPERFIILLWMALWWNHMVI